MNTQQAKDESALDRLQTVMAERNAYMAKQDAEIERHEAQRDADMEKYFEDFAKQRKEDLRWLVGISIVGIVVLGAVLRWPF